MLEDIPYNNLITLAPNSLFNIIFPVILSPKILKLYLIYYLLIILALLFIQILNHNLNSTSKFTPLIIKFLKFIII